jgi:hypothetical protein
LNKSHDLVNRYVNDGPRGYRCRDCEEGLDLRALGPTGATEVHEGIRQNAWYQGYAAAMRAVIASVKADTQKDQLLESCRCSLTLISGGKERID